MSGKAYSLKTANGRGYAIQKDMNELCAKQKRFEDFYAVTRQHRTNVAGQAATRGIVTYPEGRGSSIHYTTARHMEKGFSFERLPSAKCLPLAYTCSDEVGYKMQLRAESVLVTPVEESMFKISPSYMNDTLSRV